MLGRVSGRRVPAISGFLSALAMLAGLGAGGRVAADSTVVFNEVMYHPPANEAQLEWVELYNQMAVDMELSGWQLSGAIQYTFAESTVIEGGGFLVVAISPSALEASSGYSGALGPFTGRLGNSGERLELRDNNDRLMDSVKYQDGGEWPVAADGSGASLAKIDPDSASGPPASWSSSVVWGGTPGRPNFPLAPKTPVLLPDGLISYWSFDEPSGPALDPAGGNNGTLGSGALRVAGLVGSGAVSFNNTAAAYVDVGPGGGNSFSTSAGITIEALVRPAWSGAPGDQDEIFRKEDGAQRILLAFQNDGNSNGFSEPAVGPGPVLSFGLNLGGVYRELDMPLDGLNGRPTLAMLEDGRTHHIAATYQSSSGLKALLIDGALAFSYGAAAGSAIASGGGAAAAIGNLDGRGEPFSGVIDEVAVWRKALAPSEIADHYSRFKAGKSYFDPGSASPLPTIAINEILSSSSAEPWLELVNFGGAGIRLTSLVLTSSSSPGLAYSFPEGTLAAGGYLSLTATQLGLSLAPGSALFLYTPDRSLVLAGERVEEGLHGRSPDGTGPWLVPDRPTPGAANSFSFHREVVINEIMYHHRPVSQRPNFRDSSEAWIELYNRSGLPVDMSGWSLGGGIEYLFEPGTSLAPGEYLVVAADRDSLAAIYPGIRIAGSFQKKLSRHGDRLLLMDAAGNPVNEVSYLDGGRWPEYADGGGSSLELRDPRADSSSPEAWAASRESQKTDWNSYQYRGLASANIGPTRWNEFVLGLLDAGEALLDDLSVVESPGGAGRELIQNGDFESGSDHWRFLGNHGQSEVIVDPDDRTNHVLHLVATGDTEHMHNHLETTLAGGAIVVNGREYEVNFRARWLAGSNQLHTRLYFNRLPRTILLDAPDRNGTPGAANSRLEPNIGPTLSGLSHQPVAPAAGQEVTVSVEAQDPDGVSLVNLRWALNGGVFRVTPMARQGSGPYQAKIPGQAAGSLVQFYVAAVDGTGVSSTFPAAGPASRALYRVADGQAVLGQVHNLRILMTAADTTVLHQDTNVMSNQWMGATVVYDEKEAFYDSGVRLKGSERGRPVSGRVGYHLRFDPQHLFRGVHQTVAIDRSGGWKFGGPTGQDEILIKQMNNHAGGIPGMYDDIIRVIAPRRTETGPALLMLAAFGDVYLDSQYPRGSDGPVYKLELIYYPTTTDTGGAEGRKLPQPDDVLGTDLRDLGNDQEVYRWNFLQESHRDRDDYSRLMALCKAFSLPSATLEAGTRAVMDVDEWMRTFAMYSLSGVNDTYTQGNNHNNLYYVRPEDQKVMVFPWDMDFSFVLSTTGPLWGDQNLSRIIGLPANRRLFYSHLKDLISRSYNPTYLAPWAAHYGSLAGQDYSSIVTYIGQRRSFVLSSLPAQPAFSISTNGGQDFTVSQATTTIEGEAGFDVKEILVAERPDPLAPSWTTPSHWKATVSLDLGQNPLTFLAFDRQGTLLGSDSINVTSTSGWAAPAIASVLPAEAAPGATVTVKGSGFHAGIQLSFSGVKSPQVTFDEAADPTTLRAQVAALPPGSAQVTVQNTDGRSSPPAAFTVRPTLTFVRGDMNLDGSVDLSDALSILLHLFAGVPAACLDAGDANDDERLGIADAIYLLRYLYQSGPPPPPPFPERGPDPGGTTLGCEV
jgi:hypothetical protein